VVRTAGVHGRRGPARSIPLPIAGDRPILAFDTGVDSATVVVIPPGAWSNDADGPLVSAHPDQDETIILPTGSGTLVHGPDPDHLAAVRFSGPVGIAIAAGHFHNVVMDVGADGVATSFFTRPGAIVSRFAGIIERALPATVLLHDVPIVPTPVVPAETSSHRVCVSRSPGGLAAASSQDDRAVAPGVPGRRVRIIPFQSPENGGFNVLDTGQDSLFAVVVHGRSWNRAPVDVFVHRHDEADELILIDVGEGWILDGPTPDQVTRTPYQAPCVLVLPGGGYHRIVRTDEPPQNAILVYPDPLAVVERYAGILERSILVSVDAIAGSNVGGSR
jgi:hypothetical protein